LFIHIVEANKRVLHRFDLFPFIFVVNRVPYFAIWNNIRVTIVRD